MAEPRDAAAPGGPAGGLLALLGLARRAGCLAMGASAVEAMVARGRRPLVVVARDAGAAQQARARRLTPVRALVDTTVGRAELARALGREELTIVALDDERFAAGIERLLGGAAAPQLPHRARPGRGRR